MVNGSDCQVLKDNKALTLGDWLVNDFGLRVVYNGSQLVADETSQLYTPLKSVKDAQSANKFV